MNGTTEKSSRANKERERCEAKNKTFKYLSLWKEPPIHGFTDFCHIISTLNIYIMKSFGRCFAYGMHLMGAFKPYFLNSTYLIAILFDFHLRQMLRQFIAVQLFHLEFLFSSMSKHSIHFTIKATRVFKKFIKRDEKRLENIC